MNHTLFIITISLVFIGLLYNTPTNEKFTNNLQNAIIKLFNNQSPKYSEYLSLLKKYKHNYKKDKSIQTFMHLKSQIPLSTKNFQ